MAPVFCEKPKHGMMQGDRISDAEVFGAIAVTLRSLLRE
jgi:hypothetical protein